MDTTMLQKNWTGLDLLKTLHLTNSANLRVAAQGTFSDPAGNLLEALTDLQDGLQ
jgi:hypothetical protein